MCEFNCDQGHIIIQETHNNLAEWLTMTDSIVSIVFACITGVCAIIGIRCFGKLKERATIATFSYWTQLSLRLQGILNRLSNNYALLNNFYNNESRSLWPQDHIATADEINDFYSLSQELITFIKNANDQIPAYQGWTADFYKLSLFLDNVIKCDIRNSNMYFYKNEKCTLEQRNKYCEDICQTLQQLVDGIARCQIDKEKRLSKKRKLKCKKSND